MVECQHSNFMAYYVHKDKYQSNRMDLRELLGVHLQPYTVVSIPEDAVIIFKNWNYSKKALLYHA